MTDASENKQHIVFAVLLGIAGLLIILIFVTIRSQGDVRYDSATSTAVTNKAPTIDSIYVTGFEPSGSASSTLQLVENTTIPVYVKGTYTDLNGCDEVNVADSIVASLYRSDVAKGTNCSADNANCMPALTCSTYGCEAGGVDPTGGFTCSTTLQYFADPTAADTTYDSAYWAATATATDNDIHSLGLGFVAGSGVNTNSVDSTEVSGLTAIALGTDAAGADIPYGPLALNATSAEDVDTGWKNVGNTLLAPKVSSAADMTCTGTGSIPVANQHYATSSGRDYTTGQVALANAATNVVNANNCYAKATNGGTATGHIYWKIKLPADGISGSCTGTNVVNADPCL